MKLINIPKNSDISIDLAAIDINYSGVIIVYKENNAVGRISYYADTDQWYFYKDINDCTSRTFDESLYTLVTSLMELEIADTFKLLEFNSDNND